MNLPSLTRGSPRGSSRAPVVIRPENLGSFAWVPPNACNYDCSVCSDTSGSRVCWDDPLCVARLAACRLGNGPTRSTCVAWHEAAIAACGATSGPGFMARRAAAEAGYMECVSSL